VLFVAVAIVVAYCALNYRAYDGFFQDDELDTLSWAPVLDTAYYARAFVKPVFDRDNFRPTGHLYFTLAGKAFGLDFPPYMTPVFVIHLLNGWLLFLLMRRMRVATWQALGGAAFFVLSGSAMDAYWKPMYVFDLLCATFCLASVVLWSHRRWLLSFLAYWFAYKAKELAVMVPLVLLAWEFWFGDEAEDRRRYWRLAPFFLVSLSFGVQGILLNPNKDNEYTFRFTFDALRQTIPFYARRLLLFKMSGALLLPLLFLRDRRVWFGLFAALAFVIMLLFLPGRRYEAYAYLPLATASIAIAAGAMHVRPALAVAAIVLWLPWNVSQTLALQRAKLEQDETAFAFVDKLETWARQHPSVKTLVYEGRPGGYHNWGVTGAWNIVHHSSGLSALFYDTPEAREAMVKEIVAYYSANTLQIHSPLPSSSNQ